MKEMKIKTKIDHIKKNKTKFDYYNINIDITNKHNVISKCIDFFNSNKPHTIFFLNAHCFNIAQKNSEYQDAINKSDLLLNDGIGITLGAMFAGIRLSENLNGTDLIPEILALAASKNKKVFFLGGKDGVAEKASIKIKELIPGIKIAGFHSGYFSEDEENKVLSQINISGSELLILGMGVPKQELWASKNKATLTNIKVIISGGAILDFISGKVKRAPLWIRKTHMEWLYRLYNEPKRMWQRYLIGNILFFYHIIRLKKGRLILD